MDDNECMQTCEVGVLCPHGASCDHIGAGRITPEELEVLFMYMLRKEKELRRDRDLLWDAIRLSGTGANREEEIAFWHEKLLNMNEAELKEAFKEHYEDD